MDTSRGWLEIDLGALAHNLAVVRRRAGGAALLLVAKADAYGHGAVAVARRAAAEGVEAIGVSSAAEALELRAAGLSTRLVLLGVVLAEEAPAALEQGVEVAIPSSDVLARVEAAARRLGRSARVHLELNTGMNRLGVRPERALALLAHVQASPWLELAGVMTHLAPVEGARTAAGTAQLARFEATLAAARRAHLLAGEDVWLHAGNSAAVLAGGLPVYDAVRVGAAAYGISPAPSLEARELRPVMALRSQVVHLDDVPAGEEVGYAGTWTARRATRLAVVPLGYGDGVDWRLSNRGVVLLRGERAPIVGRVSMDFTTLDVTGLPDVECGDEVTFFGTDRARELRVEEVARTIGTIPYELLASIGRRVARVHRDLRPAQGAAASA